MDRGALVWSNEGVKPVAGGHETVGLCVHGKYGLVPSSHHSPRTTPRPTPASTTDYDGDASVEPRCIHERSSPLEKAGALMQEGGRMRPSPGMAHSLAEDRARCRWTRPPRVRAGTLCTFELAARAKVRTLAKGGACTSGGFGARPATTPGSHQHGSDCEQAAHSRSLAMLRAIVT
jgi:hypothetical protein